MTPLANYLVDEVGSRCYDIFHPPENVRCTDIICPMTELENNATVEERTRYQYRKIMKSNIFLLPAVAGCFVITMIAGTYLSISSNEDDPDYGNKGLIVVLSTTSGLLSCIVCLTVILYCGALISPQRGLLQAMHNQRNFQQNHLDLGINFANAVEDVKKNTAGEEIILENKVDESPNNSSTMQRNFNPDNPIINI